MNPFMELSNRVAPLVVATAARSFRAM